MEISANTTVVKTSPVVKGAGVITTQPKPTTTAGGKTQTPAQANAALLKALCSKLKVEPRVARRRLRAAKLPFHVLGERWVFTAAQQAQVDSIIMGNAKPSTKPTETAKKK